VHLNVGDRVRFGPPGKAKAEGKVVRVSGSKARIKQLQEAHGQPTGTEWNVPMTPEYVEITARNIYGTPSPKSARKSTLSKPKRTSRPPPPRSTPPRAAPATGPGRAPPSGDLLSHRETIDFAHELLRQWSIPNYKVVFSNKFTRRMGQCDFRHREIAYSAPLWPLATAEQRRQTTIHEVAHAVTKDRHGDVAPHGKEWKAQMVAMGASPSRTHKVNRDSVKRSRADTVGMTCCGGAPFRITMKKAHAILTRRGRCKACQQAPVFATAADRTRYEAWARGGLNIRPNSCLCGAHSLECGLVSR
jgi:predicted SprT family Zn-dependent metalloprotease